MQVSNFRPLQCETTNCKPITRGIPRFSIPVLLNMSSSVSERGVELSLQQVLAPRLASNFRLTSDSAECKINEITGETVNYSFRSITRNYRDIPRFCASI
jgi:hypothetical protein